MALRAIMAALLPLLAALSGPALVGAASPGTNPFTSAVTRFIRDNGTIESIQARDGGLPGDYKPTTVLYSFCSPPGDSETNTVASGSLVVAADGRLTGSCQATRSSTFSDGSSSNTAKQGTISGTFDLAAQTVKFHFEGTTQSTYTQPPTCKGDRCGPSTAVMGIVIDGPVTGGEVIGDTAEGTARHTFTCSPAPQCAISRQVATAKFLIQFLPALPTSAPGAPGAGGGAGAGQTSDGGVPVVPLVIGAILFGLGGLTAAELARRAARRKAGLPEEGYEIAAVGSDRSGGYPGHSYGEGAQSAAPADPKAFEALVVAQSSQSASEEPLINQGEKKAAEDEREGEKQTPMETEGR